jgi:uncharacterized membrane protein YphA (DoxX/SURF4 family)
VFVASCVVSVVLAGLLAHSATGKLTRHQKQVAGMRAIGFPVARLPWLAAAELAAAAGLLIGLVWWPVAVAALVGLVAYFVGALVFLLRAGLTMFAAWSRAAAFLAVTVVLLAFDLARASS